VYAIIMFEFVRCIFDDELQDIPKGGLVLRLVRIGDKIISHDKIFKTIDRVLFMRSEGFAQQEVADKLDIDRSFVSRLESLGEIRKGERIAVVGFPVANKEDLAKVAFDLGVDFVYLLNDRERWEFVEQKSGAALLNDVMELISQMRQFDTVIFIGSDMRIRLVEAILGKEVISIEIGESPITEDKYVDPDILRSLVMTIRR
jgi:transcriptional regulator with XRE-family HTH domain